MEKNEYLVVFKKPYSFEGKEYKEVDLSGIEHLTTEDLTSADKIYTTQGNASAMSELTVGYACILAAQATSQPLEFFQGLPANEGIKIKNILMGFLYS
jgi:hypothetical protein